jgi:AbrB family looped-hinge helix DNA binding protein
MQSSLRVTKVGTKGQVVIPSELRVALKLEAGDTVIAQLEGTRIMLERRRTVVQALAGKYARVLPKPAVVESAPVNERGQHGP